MQKKEDDNLGWRIQKKLENEEECVVVKEKKEKEELEEEEEKSAWKMQFV